MDRFTPRPANWGLRRGGSTTSARTGRFSRSFCHRLCPATDCFRFRARFLRLRSGGVALHARACPLVKIAPSFLMAPLLECGAVEHGGVRLPRARFRSYSQRWRVDISTLRLALTVLVRCRGVALCARARPLVKIAPSISFCRVRVEAVGAACVKIGERLRGCCGTQGLFLT